MEELEGGLKQARCLHPPVFLFTLVQGSEVSRV